MKTSIPYGSQGPELQTPGLHIYEIVSDSWISWLYRWQHQVE